MKEYLSIETRAACLADALACQQICQRSVRTLCTAVYTAEQIETWLSTHTETYYQSVLIVGREHFYVATHHDHVVGFAAIQGDYLGRMYVDPRYARQGVGSQLIQKVEQLCISQRFRLMRCAAALNAVPFYLHQGFRILGQGQLERAGIIIPHIEMEKSL